MVAIHDSENRHIMTCTCPGGPGGKVFVHLVGCPAVANAERVLMPGDEPLRMVGADRAQVSSSGFGLAKPGDTGDARKLDMGKPPITQGFLDYFARAIVAVSYVSEYGSRKYARPEAPYSKGWQAVPQGQGRYSDADGRHRVKQSIEGPYDSESGLAHLAHKAWNAMAELEIALLSGAVECRIGNEVKDGAPVPGTHKTVGL